MQQQIYTLLHVLVLVYSFILAVTCVNNWMPLIYEPIKEAFKVELGLRFACLIIPILLFVWKSKSKRHSMYRKISFR